MLGTWASVAVAASPPKGLACGWPGLASSIWQYLQKPARTVWSVAVHASQPNSFSTRSQETGKLRLCSCAGTVLTLASPHHHHTPAPDTCAEDMQGTCASMEQGIAG